MAAARAKKRLEKARNSPRNVSFEDLDTILQGYGFVLFNVEGSHYQYRHESGARLTIPRHKPLGKVYVLQAIAAIDNLPEDKDEK